MIETDFGRKSFWIFLILEISHIILFYNLHISSGIVRGAPPLRRAEGGGGGTPTCTRPQSRKYYKIVKKWPKNASREVEKLTPSPFGPRFFPPRPPWKTLWLCPCALHVSSQLHSMFIMLLMTIRRVDRNAIIKLYPLNCSHTVYLKSSEKYLFKPGFIILLDISKL